MKLEKQVCSLQLAKRLKELGIEQESFWSWYETVDRDDTPRLNRTDESCHICNMPKQPFEEKYSAFTVAELMGRLPMHTLLYKYENGWKCCPNGKSDYYGKVSSFVSENIADAPAQMLIYLLENKLIKLDGR
jgi:hypothetical protein